MGSPTEPAHSATKKPVLVSSCLLGRRCRYDGSHNQDHALLRDLATRGETAVPFCPEEAGGLGTPRPAAWIEGTDARSVLDGTARMRSVTGADVTLGFLEGARRALERCRDEQIEKAYLKERSPSCGVAETHVDGRRVPGPGVTTEFLRRAGIEVNAVEGRRS